MARAMFKWLTGARKAWGVTVRQGSHKRLAPRLAPRPSQQPTPSGTAEKDLLTRLREAGL